MYLRMTTESQGWFLTQTCPMETLEEGFVRENHKQSTDDAQRGWNSRSRTRSDHIMKEEK